MTESTHIERRESMPRYEPPGHTGTVNVRLCDRSFCDGFEMVLGRLEPGAEAHRHSHATEHQAMYVLRGEAYVELGDEPPVTCSPGTIIRIPPGLEHYVRNDGADALELMLVYSPPLPPRDDKPVKA